MNKNQASWSKAASYLCAEPGAEDGVGPRYLKPQNIRKKSSAKDSRLAKEAHRILSLVLAGETSNPLLRDLQVLSVLPVGNGQQLSVTVTYAGPVDEAQVLAALSHAQGLLRTLLAQSLHRKRVPMLSFHFSGLPGKEFS